MQLVAAAPAPTQVTRNVSIGLSCSSAALRTRCRRDDRRPVLVVVEDGDLHLLAERSLDHEAIWGANVLQVDRAKGRLQRAHDGDELLRVDFVDLDVEHVDVRKSLEQDSLALHHGLGGARADVPEAEHGRAVGDHAHQITSRSVQVDRVRIFGDLQAGGGDTGRIGE